MACPGQPRTVAALGDKIVGTSSPYAEEGTAAHALAEACLLNDDQAASYLGYRVSADGNTIANGPGAGGKGWYEVTDNMATAVQVYLDAMRAETQEGDEVEIEARLSVSEELWGTGDFTRYRPSTQELLVADYKHGAGKPVDLIGNPQILIYAVGAAKKLGNRGLKTVKLGIIQPRCLTVDPVRWWSFDVTELLDFWADLDVAVSATRCEDATLVSGEHCRWCPAAAYCPALVQAATTGSVPAAGEDIAAALAKIPALKAYIKAIEDEAFAVATRGGTVPGFKLIESEGNRAWADTAEAQRTLLGLGYTEADIFEPAALKSVAVAERLLGKKEFAEHMAGYVTRPKGPIKLVPDSHKAPAINRNIREDFHPVSAEPATAGIFD